MAVVAWRETEMFHALVAALGKNTRARVWANARQLPDPSMAIKKVLDALAGSTGQPAE